MTRGPAGREDGPCDSRRVVGARVFRPPLAGATWAIVRTAAALLFLAVPRLARAAPPGPWIEVKAPGSHLIVVTDAGEKSGRKIALQLTQFDRSLAETFRLDAGPTRPARSWSSRPWTSPRSVDGAGFSRRVRRTTPLSSYLVGPTQHVGALKADLPEPADKERSPSRGFYRGRASALIEGSLGKSAPWLTRGLAMFLGDSVVKDKEVLVGRMTAALNEVAASSGPAGRGILP